jgi:hypothetical protein
MPNARSAWPPLRLRDWEPTYLTLHRWTQIVGKVRMALAPPVNHWWHVPLYVTPEGLSTSTVACAHGAPNRSMSISFDFLAHRLRIHLSDGRESSFALEPMTVADFYRRCMAELHSLGVDVTIWPVPVEVSDRTPFTEDRHHASYDPEAVERVHRILLSTEQVFSRFRGKFLGKSSPVHFFWGAFDLALTRFSGRRNPDPPKDRVMGPAYSHEVISHGFWPGGDWPSAGRVEEAIFYAYSVPEPSGFASARVLPAEARYDETLHEFVLPYEAVRTAGDPDACLLDFMKSTYRAGADAAGWPCEELDTPDPLAWPSAATTLRSA